MAGLPPDEVVPMLYNAASQYGVPDYILTGVFGMETGFGADMRTSSGGAVGAMQFLPSTARAYNYPLTNTPDQSQLQQQFNAAAHYLSDLFHKTGSWDAALRDYSGGGYGLAQVTAKSKTPANANEIQPVNPGILGGGDTPGGVNPGGILGDLFSPLADIAKVISFIFSFQFLYIVGGGVLLLVALYLIARQQGMPSATRMIPRA